MTKSSSLTQTMRFRLKSSHEYSQASFAWITSVLLTLLLPLNSYDWTGQAFKSLTAALAGIYLFFTLMQSLLVIRIRRDLMQTRSCKCSDAQTGLGAYRWSLLPVIFLS